MFSRLAQARILKCEVALSTTPSLSNMTLGRYKSATQSSKSLTSSVTIGRAERVMEIWASGWIRPLR